ncbi:MAG TPA: DNA-formamidopyrimidine glycosylase family protein [Nitrospiria bacterium]|nr:DNA-formamidopyrimidine glycosylase family protein [Nitrospiria bacterium]
MPELPDITVYIDALKQVVAGQRLIKFRVGSPSVLRKGETPVSEIEGSVLGRVGRIGKRIILGFEPDRFLLIHLMIGGRLHWKKAGGKTIGKNGLAALDFENGTLMLTETGPKKQAAIHLVRGEEALAEFDAGGVEPFDIDLETFAGALKKENHTLKRALTDQRLIKGIGNAYSDEILHRAGLSPVAMTQKLNPEELRLLFVSTRGVLVDWIDRLRAEAGEGFPEKVTAFRKGMAVHGRFKKNCPVCKTSIQRIVQGSNESYYCPGCQTGGKTLSSRTLLKLLKSDWREAGEEIEKRDPARE